MTARARLVLFFGLMAGGARSAGAQVVQFNLGSDTALSVVLGDSAKIRLYISGASSVSEYALALFVDTARVQLIRADLAPGSLLPAPSLTANSTEQWTLSIPSTIGVGATTEFADLWFRMKADAVEGSLVSLRVNTLKDQAGADLLANHRTTVLNVCQAKTYWGDVSGDKVVSSRDALIALTAAVGLPVTGFDLSPGDVDADSVVTSRDALLVLSHSIRLYTGSNRLGKAKTNRCAPLHPVPNDAVLRRGSSWYKVVANDTVPVKLTLSFVPNTGYRVIPSPDGSKVLYTAFVSPNSYEIVSDNGTTATALTQSSLGDYGADWKPDGLKIAFSSERVSPPGLFVMDATGANQAQIATTPVRVYTGETVSWSPDGTRIAFVGDSSAPCCNYGIWVINENGTGLTEVLPGDSLHFPQRPVWTAGSDSIVYRHGGNGEIYIFPATGFTTRILMSRLNGAGDSPAAASTGPAFRSFVRYFYDLFLRRASDGRHFRIVRGTIAGESDLSFRRGP